MAFKAIALLLLINALVQGYSVNAENEITELEVQGLIDTVTELFNKLQEKVKAAIDSALVQIQGIVKKIQEFAASTLSKTTQQIDRICGHFFEELKKLKDAAIEAGVDITDCCKDNEPELLHLPTELIGELNTCIKHQVDRIVDMADKTVDDIKGTWNIVVDLGNEIQKCGFLNIFCLTKVLGKLTVDSVDLTVKIAGDVLKVTEFSVTVESQIQSCATSKVLAVTEKGQEILNKIGTCIKHKIH